MRAEGAVGPGSCRLPQEGKHRWGPLPGWPQQGWWEPDSPHLPNYRLHPTALRPLSKVFGSPRPSCTHVACPCPACAHRSSVMMNSCPLLHGQVSQLGLPGAGREVQGQVDAAKRGDRLADQLVLCPGPRAGVFLPLPGRGVLGPHVGSSGGPMCRPARVAFQQQGADLRCPPDGPGMFLLVAVPPGRRERGDLARAPWHGGRSQASLSGPRTKAARRRPRTPARWRRGEGASLPASSGVAFVCGDSDSRLPRPGAPLSSQEPASRQAPERPVGAPAECARAALQRLSPRPAWALLRDRPRGARSRLGGGPRGVGGLGRRAPHPPAARPAASRLPHVRRSRARACVPRADPGAPQAATPATGAGKPESAGQLPAWGGGGPAGAPRGLSTGRGVRGEARGSGTCPLPGHPHSTSSHSLA